MMKKSEKRPIIFNKRKRKSNGLTYRYVKCTHAIVGYCEEHPMALTQARRLEELFDKLDEIVTKVVSYKKVKCH